jgi:hypothetical protein
MPKLFATITTVSQVPLASSLFLVRKHVNNFYEERNYSNCKVICNTQNQNTGVLSPWRKYTFSRLISTSWRHATRLLSSPLSIKAIQSGQGRVESAFLVQSHLPMICNSTHLPYLLLFLCLFYCIPTVRPPSPLRCHQRR